MSTCPQHTLSSPCEFAGKGLHTGIFARMRILPSPPDSGVTFVRSDLGGACIPALAENVTRTARSTTIACGEASVTTIEHVLSALTGLGIDNARIEVAGPEVPILDGSAAPFVQGILDAGITAQDAPRRYIEFDEPLTIASDRTGSVITISPCDHLEIELTADFNSRVLGEQRVTWTEGDDYASAVAPCRTFVFYHEIEALARQGLVRGGDVDNAIVIVEDPVPQESVDSLCDLLGAPRCKVTSSGYLDNITLRFADECGRHKLLDILGDLRLCGGFIHARVNAYRPGHTINTNAAKAVRKSLNANE